MVLFPPTSVSKLVKFCRGEVKKYHGHPTSIPAKAIERNSPYAGKPVESFEISVNGWIDVTIKPVIPS